MKKNTWIKKEAQAILPEMIKIRRDFHKFAEPGWMEMRTTSCILKELENLQIDVKAGREIYRDDSRMGLPTEDKLEEHYIWASENGAYMEYLPLTKNGYTGAVAEIKGVESDGPVTVLRFDIDALGVTESSSSDHIPVMCDFKSIVDGVMHACGHDGHAAMGIATAKLLSKHRNEFRGIVRIIFQPAEEGVRGGKSIVCSGFVDDADYVLAAHIFPDEGSDAMLRLTSDKGRGSLATTKLDMDFYGRATHAGIDPQNGNNALLAASTAILNMHAIPRFGKEATHINVGRVMAGTGRNVVCDHAHIEAETRGATSEANKYMEDRAKHIAVSSADMQGCTVDIKIMGAAPVMNNSKELVDTAKTLCEDKLGYKVEILSQTGNGSEDFAYYTEKTGNGLYMQLPCKCAAANHNVNFDFDESVMARGVELICEMVLELARK